MVLEWNGLGHEEEEMGFPYCSSCRTARVSLKGSVRLHMVAEGIRIWVALLLSAFVKGHVALSERMIALRCSHRVALD